MAVEGFTALQDASRKALTTPDRAKYWLKLLGVETVKCGHVRYVPDGEISRLGTMARFVESGMSPADAAKKAREETAPPVPTVPAVQPAPAPDTRLEGIEKALLAMAEKMNGLVETNRVILEENRLLRSEILSMQKMLEYNKHEPARKEQKKESLSLSASQNRATVQRELSLWESVQLSMNDVTGFLFGRG